MHRGFVKLYRCMQDNPLWCEGSFSRGQAWIDMLMLANHQEGAVRRRGIKVNVKRGEVAWAYRSLAERWKWSVGKVQRFMEDLKSDNQIAIRADTENINVTSLIVITNYDLYQDTDTETDTKTIRKRVQNKNEKNEKKEKPLEHFPNALDIFEKCWEEYPRKKGRALAWKHFKATVKDVETARRLFSAIQNYIAEEEGTDMKHLKHGSSFFAVWSEYA